MVVCSNFLLMTLFSLFAIFKGEYSKATNKIYSFRILLSFTIKGLRQFFEMFLTDQSRFFFFDKKFLLHILWNSRRDIWVTFPYHLKKLRSKLKFWLEKLNCGFFHSFLSKFVEFEVNKKIFSIILFGMHKNWKCLANFSML